MKPGSGDIKHTILISGLELEERKPGEPASRGSHQIFARLDAASMGVASAFEYFQCHRART